MEITVQEYRAGNKQGNAPDKITGIYKVPDVTLKRGVMGDDTLYTWLDEVRNGKQAEALRTVTIELLSEDGEPAQVWKLKGARPIKYTGPALSGKATDVAIEELVLAVRGHRRGVRRDDDAAAAGAARDHLRGGPAPRSTKPCRGWTWRRSSASRRAGPLDVPVVVEDPVGSGRSSGRPRRSPAPTDGPTVHAHLGPAVEAFFANGGAGVGGAGGRPATGARSPTGSPCPACSCRAPTPATSTAGGCSPSAPVRRAPGPTR